MANPRSPLPYDYDADRTSIARRQAMADAIVKQSITPQDGEMISGHYVAPGIGGAIQQIAGAYFGNKQQEAATQATRDLTERYNTDKTKAMQDYQAAFEQDPRQAAIKGVASSFPELNKLAMEDAKNIPTTKDMLPFADPQAIKGMVQGGGINAFAPKVELKSAAPGEVMIDQGGRIVNPTPPAGGGQGWGLQEANGDLYQTSATGMKKLDNAPKISTTNITNNKGPNALAEEMAKVAAKDYGEIAKGVQSAHQALDNVAKFRSLGKDIYSGPAANAAVFTNQFLSSLGVPVDKQKLANSETAQSETTQAWLNAMNAAGGSRGITEVESTRIAAALPGLLQTPEGREQLMQMIEDRAYKTIAEGAQKQQAIEAAGTSGNPVDYFKHVTDSPLEGMRPPSSPIGDQAPAGGKTYNPVTRRLE